VPFWPNNIGPGGESNEFIILQILITWLRILVLQSYSYSILINTPISSTLVSCWNPWDSENALPGETFDVGDADLLHDAQLAGLRVLDRVRKVDGRPLNLSRTNGKDGSENKKTRRTHLDQHSSSVCYCSLLDLLLCCCCCPLSLFSFLLLPFLRLFALCCDQSSDRCDCQLRWTEEVSVSAPFLYSAERVAERRCRRRRPRCVGRRRRWCCLPLSPRMIHLHGILFCRHHRARHRRQQ